MVRRRCSSITSLTVVLALLLLVTSLSTIREVGTYPLVNVGRRETMGTAISTITLSLWNQTANDNGPKTGSILDGNPTATTSTINAVLVSGYSCQNCTSTLVALEAFTSCTARALGIQHYRFLSNVTSSSSAWPYPHYLKLAAIHSVLQDPQLHDVDWLIWVDADVRILPTTAVLLRRVLGSATQKPNHGVHLVVSCPHHYASLLNNIFFLSMSKTGRRFFDFWKQLVDGGPTCGSYDQCHFGIAILQLLKDYSKDKIGSNDNTSVMMESDAISMTIDKELQHMAWEIPGVAVEHHEMKDAFNRVLHCPSDRASDASGECTPEYHIGPKQVGPVLFVPAWIHPQVLSRLQNSTSTNDDDNNKHGEEIERADDSLPSLFSTGWSLSIEPSHRIEVLMEHYHRLRSAHLPQPLSVHGKYSTAFCRRRGRMMEEPLKNAFRQTYFGAAWQAVCTPAEMQRMNHSNNGLCWASLP